MLWLLCAFALADAPADAPSEGEDAPAETSDTGSVLDEIARALAADTGDDAADAPHRPSRGAPQSMNPALSFIADFALAAFSDDPLQMGAHDPQDNGFNLQQLELSVGAPVDPYLRFDANLVFAPFGVEIEEAYATTTALPWRLQVRAGQFLTRFGRTNPTHPHAWDFVDQPFALGRVFGGEGNRGLGVEASVLLPLPWYVELIASETMANGAATARSFYGARDLGVSDPGDLQTTLAARQFFPFGDDLSLLWGVSFAGGPNPTGRTNRSEVYGTDAYLKWRPIASGRDVAVTFTSEWFHRRRQVPDDVLADWNGFSALVWRLRRVGLGARHEVGTPARGLDGELAHDPLDPYWTATRHRLSAEASFYPTEFSRLRLQGASDLRGWRDEPVFAAFLALEIVAGAHGPHHF